MLFCLAVIEEAVKTSRPVRLSPAWWVDGELDKK